VRALWLRIKAGHAGSLDPLATGMLPICLGEATKVAGEMVAARKRYLFTVALGSSTASGDAEGPVSATAPVPPLEWPAVEAVLAGFLGLQQQIPPMYSALKRAGEPLYRLARAGVTVEREARAIELSELKLLGLTPQTLELEALCSKGTYIRVLAQDIAARLGTLGHVTALRRLYVEPFEREPMQTLETLAAERARGAWPALLPPDLALAGLPAVHLAADESRRVQQGQHVVVAASSACGRVRLYGEAGSFLGIGVADGRGGVQPRRLLVPFGSG
jgi:tRNA pseudouridine55 synthase